MIEIVSAQTGSALDHLILLAHEYVNWMLGEIRQHYPDLDTHEFAAEHAYDDIRKKFPGEHVPPNGCLLVALYNGEACGCIAVGRLSEHICEIRTLYVKPTCRGTRVGRKLVDAALDQARSLGYDTARLDTLEFMQSARKLYRSLGFYEIPPYLELSDSLKQHIGFFELKLTT